MFLHNDHLTARSKSKRVFVWIVGLSAVSLGLVLMSRTPTIQSPLITVSHAQSTQTVNQPGAHAESSPVPAEQNAASVTVEQGLIKFYFASGQAVLASGASDALRGMVQAAGTHGRLVITGFHDASGDPARNLALAKQRAQSVRSALKALGVRDAKIEIRQPQSLPLDDNSPEARRVEISLQ